MSGPGHAAPKHMRRYPILALALALSAATSSAATLQQLSLDDLIQKSTAIVRAKVVDSYADFRGKELFTHWKLQVEDQWKGKTAVEVMGPGGSLGGYRQNVPGAPQLSVGKEYVLFLWTSKSGATYLTGWGQGVYELSGTSASKLVATRAAVGETMVEQGTWRPVKDTGVQMPLSELGAKISAVLGEGASR